MGVCCSWERVTASPVCNGLKVMADASFKVSKQQKRCKPSDACGEMSFLCLCCTHRFPTHALNIDRCNCAQNTGANK
eukprot:scaffold166716_cov17-Tisochrysis_lutea.AAC.1